MPEYQCPWFQYHRTSSYYCMAIATESLTSPGLQSAAYPAAVAITAALEMCVTTAAFVASAAVAIAGANNNNHPCDMWWAQCQQLFAQWAWWGCDWWCQSPLVVVFIQQQLEKCIPQKVVGWEGHVVVVIVVFVLVIIILVVREIPQHWLYRWCKTTKGTGQQQRQQWWRQQRRATSTVDRPRASPHYNQRGAVCSFEHCSHSPQR